MIPNELTFHRLQTDSPASITVFISRDATFPDGTIVPTPWEAVSVALTKEEIMMAIVIVDRAKQAYCDAKNITSDNEPIVIEGA